MKMLPISAFVVLAIVVGAAVVEMSDGMAAPDTDKTYNVIYVLTDDQRYDELGFMNPVIDTPNMDRLASEGVHFSNAFVTTSLCSPSRASILTGQYMHNHGVVDNNRPPREGTVFFPQYLQTAGYETAFIGKWHMGEQASATSRRADPQPGFDHWVSFAGQGRYYPTVRNNRVSQININGTQADQKGYITDELTDYALDWLQNRDDDKPFFMYFSHKAVHANFLPAERHSDQYADQTIGVPDSQTDIPENYDGKPMWVKNQRNSWHGVDFPYHSDLDVQAYQLQYHRTLSAVDESLGRIFAWLEESGHADDTIIVLMGDNGFMFGEHGLIDKRNAYEESMRVPLLAMGPGLKAGSIVEEIVANIDIAPSVLEIAGVEPQDHFDGRSFYGLARGEVTENWRNELLYEYYWEFNYPSTPTTFALRTDDYKFIQYHGVWDTEELYDMKNDPREMDNLIDDPSYLEVVARLRSQLFARLQSARGDHTIPYTEKFSHGAVFRHRDRSEAAEFSENWLRKGDEDDLRNFMVPDAVRAESQAPPQLGKSPIDEVIAALTTEEKVLLVLGTGINAPNAAPDRQAPLVGGRNDRVPGAAGNTFAIPRLGIPSMVLADGPAGLRIRPRRENDPEHTFFCTAFPVATLLASTWDTQLVERVGNAIGNEVKEYGVDLLLAPALNIHRIPLGGRNFEYFSEDPLLSGKIAAAIVTGVQSNGVGTTLKHFVANNHEWNRRTINVIADQRALREIYYKGFETAVKESQPWAIMTSYNKVNGTYTSERQDLMTSILREQWGFEGLVMTDWFAGRDAIAQMDAGTDLLMPGTRSQYQTLLDAIESGRLDESVLDRNIKNILQIVLKSPIFNGYQYSNKPDLEGNARLARAAAAQGMILLQNDASVLPLPTGMKLAVFGNSSYEIVTGGTGSGDVNEAYSISLLQGLTTAGFSTHGQLEESYTAFINTVKAEQPPPQRFTPTPMLPERALSSDEVSKVAAESDMALITIGRNSGEFADRKAEDDFYLSAVEKSLLTTVSEAFHEQQKKVVVVLNIGGVIETASWRDQADAILLAWQPGQEAGNAIADVLSGKVNPSGKLATTFSISLDDFPSAKNYPGVVLEESDPDDPEARFGAKAAEIVYQDGHRVGYRAMNSNDIKLAYEFGFGLSYTQFTFGDLKLSSGHLEDKLTASITITNSGQVAGKEVVQLYISAPESSLDKPEAELRAFGKTRLLQPQESQTLTFEITDAELVSFDPAVSKWVADAGEYTLQVGASSIDIRSTANFQKPEQVALSP